MKFLISFLCCLFVTNLAFSYPTDDSEELGFELHFLSVLSDFSNEEGSGEEFTLPPSLPASTLPSTSLTSTTEEVKTIETTTKAPKNYEIEELIEKISTRFNDLRTKFLKNQQDIYDEVKLDLEKYKSLRDSSIELIKGSYDYEIQEVNENLESIEEQKVVLQKSIKELQQDSATKEENLNKVEILKLRSKLLADMKGLNCDDCDGFLDNYQIDIELKKNDNKIAQLEEKIQKQENETENGVNSVANQLNTKYLELIHIYQKEVEERKKKEKLELVNSIINDKWKNYGEKVADLHAKVEAKMEKLTRNSLILINLTIVDNIDDDWKEFNLNPDTYKWISFDKYTKLPSDAVFGGEDTDGTKLYIIRTKKDDSYLYGKFAKSRFRNEVYVTNNEAEINPSSFEILTTKNAMWCNKKIEEIKKDTIPVCRVTHSYARWWYHQRIIIPGTLLKDGKCRVGYGGKVFTYAENIQVLEFGSCENSASSYDIKSFEFDYY